MNKVITINLGGNAYQLEEASYDALRTYLETASSRLKGNPDRDEIIQDIERAIGEKFRALLGNYKTVIETKEVNSVISEMGPIEADAGPGMRDAGETDSAGGRKATGDDRTAATGALPRRLYRIDKDSMIAGVCTGIGEYLSIDPTFIRLAFVLLAIFWGTGLMLYIVLALVIPEAVSPEEKAAASGSPATAQEFIRRAREGYYEAVKGFSSSKARRFKREMRAHAHQWRYNWHNRWNEYTAAHPGLVFTLPVLSLLSGIAMVIWICAMISLLGTGAIFGMALPGGVPVWVAAIFLIFAYGVIAGPMKAARRMYHWSLGGQPGAWSFVVLMDAVVWIFVTAILLCLAVHYFPELVKALQSIPSLVHQAGVDINTWWGSK